MTVTARPGCLSLACALAFIVIYLVGVVTEPGQRLDDHLLIQLQHLGAGPISHVWPFLARRIVPLLLLAAVVVVGMLARGRKPTRIAEAVGVVGASTGLSLLLKGLLARPDHSWQEAFLGNTYPSTHVSATVSLIAALWLMRPAKSPWPRSLLGSLSAFVAVGNVVGHAHRPSDVVGSLLLVGFVTGLVVMVDRLARGASAQGATDS